MSINNDAVPQKPPLRLFRTIALGVALGWTTAMLAVLPTASIAATATQTQDDSYYSDDCQDDFCDDTLWDDEFDDAEETLIHDPIEPFNRAMFWFNDKLYFLLLKPIARTTRLIPEPVRISFDHFFTNLEHPIYAANAALQLKFKESAINLARFGINSTIGFLGFFDPARHAFKLNMQEEDFGQTLGHYGVGSGFYLVVPFLGSSSFRDLLGRGVDLQITPSHLILDDSEKELIYRTSDSINEFSLDKNTYELVKETALDPYLFVRDAYQQRREKQIQQ